MENEKAQHIDGHMATVDQVGAASSCPLAVGGCNEIENGAKSLPEGCRLCQKATELVLPLKPVGLAPNTVGRQQSARVRDHSDDAQKAQ